MGNRQSTANIVSETINKSMTNVLMSNSQTCQQNNNSAQELKIENITAKDGCSLSISGISQQMVQAPNFSCSSNSSNEADLLAKFKTELEQQASATMSGFSSAINSSVTTDVKNKLVNDITSNINVSNTSQCVQNNIAEQSASLNKITSSCPIYCWNPTVATACAKSGNCDFSKCEVQIKDISQSITQEAVANCLSSNSNVTNIINEASNKIEQTADTKDEGISMGQMMISLVIILIILFMSGSSAMLLFIE